jgi:hypothetical protein
MADAQATYAEFYYSTYAPEIARASVDLYNWQNHANEVLLWVVSALTLSGVALAAAQLYWSFKAQIAPGNSGIETSPGSVKLTSPFVGVIILFLSFSFYSLFVFQVYTIRDPGSDQQSQRASAPTVPTSEPSFGGDPISDDFGYGAGGGAAVIESSQ